MNQISDLNKGKITHWCYTTTNEVAERLTDVGKNMRVSINNPQTTKKTRKNSMLANLDIKRWYDNTARGSRNTAEVRLRRLDRFCQLHQITPMELIELGRRDLKTITDLLEDHVSMMEEKGYAPAYIEGLLKSVKSWLRHFDVIDRIYLVVLVVLQLCFCYLALYYHTIVLCLNWQACYFF